MIAVKAFTQTNQVISAALVKVAFHLCRTEAFGTGWDRKARWHY